MIYQLAVNADCLQTRLLFNRQIATVSGYTDGANKQSVPLCGWDYYYQTFSGDDPQTWVCPVTGTLMLRPLPLTNSWNTTSSGDYARILKSGLTFNDSSLWTENAKDGTNKTFVSAGGDIGDTDRRIVTNTTWSANQPFFLRVFVHGWGSGKSIAAEFGWATNSTAGETAGVSGIIFTDGVIEIFKDGVFVESGSVGEASKSTESGANAVDGFLDLILIPYRQRQLLVHSSLGGSFVVTFEDLEEGVDNAITSASPFWLYFPNGTPEFELAQLRFVESAYRCSLPWNFADPPQSGQSSSFSVSYGGSGTVSSKFVYVDSVGTTFVPNGDRQSARLRIDLVGNGDSTPFVYWASGEFEPWHTDTDDSEQFDMLPYLLNISHDCPEDDSGQSLTLTLKNETGMQSAGYAFPRFSENRPIELREGSYRTFSGFSETPERTVKLDPDVADEPNLLHMQVRSRWKSFENYRFAEKIVLDGLTLTNAFKKVLFSVGMPDNQCDIEDFGFTLPSVVGSGSKGDYAVEIQVGDTAAEWLNRLHDDYCANCLMGFVPSGPNGMVFKVASKEALGTDPVITIYLTTDDALADGVSESDYHKVVVEAGYTFHYLPAVANQIWMMGLDRRTNRPILRKWTDAASCDPTVAPSLRGRDWKGETFRAGQRTHRLTDEASVERATLAWAERACFGRDTLSCTVQRLYDNSTGLPVWKGQCVKVYGEGTFRVISFSTDFQLFQSSTEADPSWAPTKYALVKVLDVNGLTVSAGSSEGLGGNSRGTDPIEMHIQAAMRLGVLRDSAPGFEDAFNRAPVSSSEL